MFIGRISNDPKFEVKQGNNGEFKKCLFSVAVNRNLTANQRNDSNATKVDFINFCAFGATAQFVNDYFKKGKPIEVMAEFQTYTVENNGTKEYKYSFIAHNVGFTVSDSAAGGDAGNNNQQTSKPATQAPKSNSNPYEIAESELPF